MLGYENYNIEALIESLKNRGMDVKIIIDLQNTYQSYKEITNKINNYKIVIKELNNKIRINRDNNLIKERELININLDKEELKLKKTKNEYINIKNKIPNILNKEVPIGIEFKIIKSEGNPNFNIHCFDIKEIFNDCSIICGNRFVSMKGDIATLYRSVIMFCSNYLLEKGYTENTLPVLLKKSILEKTRHLPHDEGNMFSTQKDLLLIPTGECTLLALNYNKLFSNKELPIKIFGTSGCFRGEAGAYGKDVKGPIRVHYFNKTEKVILCKQEDSRKYLDLMINETYDLLGLLELPRRIILLPSMDIGWTSSITFDIETVIGGVWREIASTSDTEIYQSSELNIRYVEDNKKKYVHALNGSSLPVDRLLAAIIENNYEKEFNRIRVPVILREYIKKDYILLKNK